MNDLRLENEWIEAVFDGRSGAMLALTNKKTGWRLQGREKLAMCFRMLVAMPERNNNPVLGEKQILSAVRRSEDGQTLVFTWQHLLTEHGGEVDITFRGTVALAGAQLSFRGEVENRSPYPVEDVSYPCIGDLRSPEPGQPFHRMNPTYIGMQKTSLYPRFMTERGYWGTDEPVQIVSDPYNSFVLACTEKEGLYVGFRETQLKYLVEYAFDLKPGNATTMGQTVPQTDEIGGKPVHLVFRVVHLPFVQPGERMALADIVLCPYEGTWHSGADHYKQWRQTWFRRARTAAWADQVHAWQQIQINSSADELRLRYTQLAEIGEECARHGVEAIQLVGWTIKGQDGRTPYHDIDPRLGTWEELRAAIEQIQVMGVKVVLYTKYSFAETATDWFREELYKHASKDIWGDIHSFPGYNYMTQAQLANINTHRLAVMCFNSEEWRRISVEEFRKCLALGADGMLFDESMHHANLRYCFDPDHGHHVPAYNGAGDALLEADFHKLTDEDYPDFLYAAEAVYDLQQMHYSLSYARVYDADHIAVQRYIDPYAQIMVGVAGYDDRETLNICLMYRYIISYESLHFKGRLEDFPLTLEYGKKIDALRRRYREYLWDAEYRDTLGARVTAGGKRYGRYAVYKNQASGKRAVIVGNFEGAEDLQVEVEWDGANGAMVCAAPESPETQPFDGCALIPPRSVLVIMES